MTNGMTPCSVIYAVVLLLQTSTLQLPCVLVCSVRQPEWRYKYQLLPSVLDLFYYILALLHYAVQAQLSHYHDHGCITPTT